MYYKTHNAMVVPEILETHVLYKPDIKMIFPW